MIGGRRPELTSLDFAKSFRTDVPPDVVAAPQPADWGYLVPVLLVLIAVVIVLAYLFFWR